MTADLNDFDDPLGNQSSRQPLAGNIGSSSSSRPLNENYLTSSIPGEDRRAPQNTIDETVWETLRRDLLAVWAKLREVLYPRYLLGGTMFDSEGGLRGAYSNLRGAGISGTREELTGLASRVMDAEALLQSNMSPGLRDWDLWGPLIFCLLLSLLLSFTARADQKDAVFSGVFAMIWLGEAVVTLQIKLLGGNMYVGGRALVRKPLLLTAKQLLCPERLHHRLHPVSAGAGCSHVGPQASLDCAHPGLSGAHLLVSRGRREHPRRKRRCQESRCNRRLSAARLLLGTGLPVLHQLNQVSASSRRVEWVEAETMATGMRRRAFVF